MQKHHLLFAAAYLSAATGILADEALPRGHVRITGVEVKAIDRVKEDGKINDRESAKLTHWIRFDVHPKFEPVPGTAALPHKIIDPVVAAESRMTLDKPVKFGGKDVPAGTNLLDFKKFDGSFFNVSMPDLFPFAIHSARIQSGFEIPADTYVVTFEWKTAGGEIFSDKVRVEIDVELPAGR